jgi:hypothetical protein
MIRMVRIGLQADDAAAHRLRLRQHRQHADTSPWPRIERHPVMISRIGNMAEQLCLRARSLAAFSAQLHP